MVFGTIGAIEQVLSVYGWKINTAFVERLNLDIRQRVAAIGRRVNTLGQGEDGMQQAERIERGGDAQPDDAHFSHGAIR